MGKRSSIGSRLTVRDGRSLLRAFQTRSGRSKDILLAIMGTTMLNLHYREKNLTSNRGKLSARAHCVIPDFFRRA